MSDELGGAVRDVRVRGLLIALVTERGATHLGFAASDGGYFRLAGAVQLLGAMIIDERMLLKKAAAGAASGETDEGNPQAHKVEGPKEIGSSTEAPAGGV